MIQLVVILKALVEVALIACLGQAALFVLAGTKRDTNLIYSLFKVLTSPVMRAGRVLAPRFVLDEHVPFFAFFLLLVAEVALIVAKVYLVRAAVAGP